MKLITLILIYGLGFCGFVYQTFTQHQVTPNAWDGWTAVPPTKGATIIPISGHLKTVVTLSTNDGFRITNLTQIFYVGPVGGERFLEVKLLEIHKEIGRVKIYEK